MGELDSKYVDEAINYKKKAKSPVGLSGERWRLAYALL